MGIRTPVQHTVHTQIFDYMISREHEQKRRYCPHCQLPRPVQNYCSKKYIDKARVLSSIDFKNSSRQCFVFVFFWIGYSLKSIIRSSLVLDDRSMEKLLHMAAPWWNNHNHAPSLFLNSNKELSLTQLVGGVRVHTHQPGSIPSNLNSGAYFFLYAIPPSSS